MYSLFTILSLQDLIVSVRKGSRYCSYHLYNSNGLNHARFIAQNDWEKEPLTTYDVGSIITSPDLGITALVHQGYIVECAPIAKGADKQQLLDAIQSLCAGRDHSCGFVRQARDWAMQLEEQDGFFEAQMEYTRSKEFHEHAMQNVLKHHNKPKTK